MSCDCPTSPDSDTPDTLSAQLTALVNTLFGPATITVVGDRPVYQACFSEADLSNPGGVLCALKELFETATGATTDTVSLIQYSCLPSELTPTAQTVTNTLTLRDPAGGSSDLYFLENPEAVGVEVGDQVSGNGITPGTVVTGYLTEMVGDVVTTTGVTLDLPATSTTSDLISFSRLAPAPCTLGQWICWASSKLVSLETWKTETKSELQGFVLQQVGDATASMGTAIFNLQTSVTALAASNALLQGQVAGLQTAYNALLARVVSLETLTAAQGTTLSGKADAATVVTLAGQVSTLTSEVAARLRTPSFFPVTPYWTTGGTGVGASKLLADSAWHTIDIRKGFDDTTGTGIGTGLPSYALLAVTTLAAQGGIEVAFSPASGPEADLFKPVITYALGSHSASAKVTTPVLVPLSGAANPAPVLFKYKITPAGSSHYETVISLIATF